jgi:hypothetical protein
MIMLNTGDWAAFFLYRRLDGQTQFFIYVLCRTGVLLENMMN